MLPSRFRPVKSLFRQLCTSVKFGGYTYPVFKHIFEEISPFVSEVLGIKLDSISHSHLSATLRGNEAITGNPILPAIHGGVIASFIDHCGGFCAWTVLSGTNHNIRTIDLRIDYLKTANPIEGIVCDCEVLSVAGRMIRVDVTCWDKLRTKQVAIGRGLFNLHDAVIGHKSLSPMVTSVSKSLSDGTRLFLLGLVRSASLLKIRAKPIKPLHLTKENREHVKLLDEKLDENGLTFREVTEKWSPFGRHLGFRAISLQKGRLSIALPFSEKLIGNFLIPCLHGGVTASLMDHCGGLAAWSMVYSSHKRVSTVDLRIDYLKPAPCAEIVCDAVVVHHGERAIRVDMVVWDTQRHVKVATGRALFNVYSVEPNDELFPGTSTKQKDAKKLPSATGPDML